MTVRVFQMDECTWYAAHAYADAARQYTADCGEVPDPDYGQDPLSDGDLDRMNMIDDPDSDPENRTTWTFREYRAEIESLIEEGDGRYFCGIDQ